MPEWTTSAADWNALIRALLADYGTAQVHLSRAIDTLSRTRQRAEQVDPSLWRRTDRVIDQVNRAWIDLGALAGDIEDARRHE